MTREEKAAVIDGLTEKLASAQYVYVADSSGLTVENVNKLRRLCFQRGVEFTVVKNTLLRKAMERTEKGFDGLYDHIKGPSALMIHEVGNVPAILIKEFRKDNPKPVLKGAFIDSAIYVGDDQIDALVKLKSKAELIGDIVFTLQSPARNVISALQSGGNKLAGIVKTLESR
jgi:large subunit ribosomal protein L10